MKILRRKTIEIVAFLHFVVLFFPQQTFAVSQPNCSQFSATLTTDSPQQLFVSAGAGMLTDDSKYEFVYQIGGRKAHNGPLQGETSEFSHTFDLHSDLLTNGNGVTFISTYPDGDAQYCAKTIRINSETGLLEIVDGSQPDPFVLCKQAGDKLTTCQTCFEEGKIWTGVGCIPFTTGGGMIKTLISLGLSITGTIVVLMTLYAGFLFSTSQGDPKRVDEAKSAMTSAIVGAFFIIFSVTILNFIGVTVLHLPSFG